MIKPINFVLSSKSFQYDLPTRLWNKGVAFCGISHSREETTINTFNAPLISTVYNNIVFCCLAYLCTAGPELKI
jgi:hypothetical protein